MAKRQHGLLSTIVTKLSQQPACESGCELCRQDRDLTFHHLIPRKLHRRNSFRKRYTREALNQGINICKICHRGLHRLYDEMTLAKQFNDRQRILDDPDLARHIEWSAKQKVTRYNGVSNA